MHAGDDRLHELVALRLATLEQRYTRSRRALVDVLCAAGRPLTIPEILGAGRLPQSSAYRNLTALADAGVARRVPGPDDVGRFELAEEVSGHHHHHLVCTSCGTVADVGLPEPLERALAEAVTRAADQSGFEVTDHRIDLVGRCGDCR